MYNVLDEIYNIVFNITELGDDEIGQLIGVTEEEIKNPESITIGRIQEMLSKVGVHIQNIAIDVSDPVCDEFPEQEFPNY